MPTNNPQKENKMTWNLWIDDMRDPKTFLKFTEAYGHKVARNPGFQPYIDGGLGANDFVWAKSAHEAIELIKERGMPEFMGLDHDLGDHTIFVFLNWLNETNQKAPHPAYWWVHSSNFEGAKNIRAFLHSLYRVQNLDKLEEK